jgi:hypothetical protein
MTPEASNYLRDYHGLYISSWVSTNPPRDDDLYLFYMESMPGVFSCIKKGDMEKLIKGGGLDVFAESAKLQIIFNGVSLRV